MSQFMTNYFEVTKDGQESKESVQTLQAYSKFYNQYDEGCTLFLVYDAKSEVISTDDFVNIFKKQGDIIVAQNVDHCLTLLPTNIEFCFHRLVFVSKKEAEKGINLS